jgi:intracellular multiplication protein IcmO
MAQYKGASRDAEISSQRRRKDTRTFSRKFKDLFESSDGVVLGLFVLAIMALVLVKVPLSGELMLLMAWIYRRKFIEVKGRGFDFPYRVPLHAGVGDGSYPRSKDQNTGKMEWKQGTGITYLAQDLENKEQVYSGDSDLRTHMLVLGTTGSGKPQPVDANVLTPEGWRKMGALSVGDIVCTPDGKTAPILRVFEQGVQEVWTLRLRDGRKAQATGEHLWRVLIRHPDGREEAQTITTDGVRCLLDGKARVMLPVVRRKRRGAKMHGWVPIWKVESSGEKQCRCIEIDHPHHLYVTDDNIVTHNTEFLLGLVFNALVQNTGFIYVDGKGDPKLQKEIFRLARYLGREDDLLIINFITSGRDFVEKQFDKVTNNMNLMANTSSGMLIELIVSLMDDSGGGGDMWKGRAIMFVAALTRPLIYLRDKGHINLSPEKYLEFFELNVIEELVWEHNGRYGDMFDVIVAPLRSYLVTLPGYQKSKIKKQEQKTLEQHGFIVMQLTRTFNDLTFNYGHIFKSKVGDVDFFDVVINRRMLVVLLPALERAPDSLRMLGKMIVGSIKQMMAGCLGNRVEGVVREIIDSRPTNAPAPFYTILDEYGYYAVVGFAVAPAQARSLGFAVIFAAQDFSSLKKSSAEEADATWENTNVRAIGRLTSGEESETWRRIAGASGQASEAMMAGFNRKMGVTDEKFTQQDNVTIERRSRLDYDDLAAQENGEFTLLIGKKEAGGKSGGVRVIRGMGFYTASATPKEMRINDLIPVEPPEPSDLPQNRKALEALTKALVDGSFREITARCHKANPTLIGLHQMFERNYADKERPRLGRGDVSFAVLGWFLGGSPVPQKSSTSAGSGGHKPEAELIPLPTASASVSVSAQPVQTVAEPPPQTAGINVQQIAADRALAAVCAMVEGMPKDAPSAYASAVPVEADEDEEIRIDAGEVTSLLQVTNSEADAFRDKALPILRSCLLMLDDVDDKDDESGMYDEMAVAERDSLLDAEMAASEEGFVTLEEKFAAEDRINDLHARIDDETRYPVEPMPEARSVDEMRLSLAELAELCKQGFKDGLRDIP